MKIGITHSKNTQPVNYIRAVEKIGAEPILLSTRTDLQCVNCLQGLLFSGGGDLCPSFYGQQPHPLCQSPDLERDALEFMLVEQAFRYSLPILGICRGIQVVNCALGGSLTQHLAEAELHRAKEQDVWHSIDIMQDSILYALYGKSSMVNSAHHQGVDKIAPLLHATAVAGNCTEALEGDDILLVQFHPERMGEAGLAVFQWLKQAIAHKDGKS